MKVELLAPGGSLESVKAAINAGADAVYTGGQMFGAREYADNLNTEQMIEALQYAHVHGRKIYLTVNTLLKDREIKEKLYDYLLPFYQNGLDAVIVQDYGVMKFIRDNFPGLPIHASTQMTIMGEKTASFLKDYGVTRIVTPRELSLKEIKNIYDNTHMEIESFVHGALCYCYSGQCFLSSYIGGRSGNRGKCAQPCRLNYDVIKDGVVLNPGDNKYVLSPKDICTLKILPDIIEAGVCSLKIEGRMKKTEYTAGITALYRKYLDMYLLNGKEGYYVSDEDIQMAMDLFNRNGFNESYYKIHNGKEMISLKKPTFRMENSSLVKTIREKYIELEPKEKINIFITILKDTNINMVVTCGNVCVDITGNVPQTAQKAPLTRDTVVKQISKLGNTPFVAEHIEITMDDGLFITMGELNSLRREMAEKLVAKLTSQYNRDIDNVNVNITESDNVKKNSIKKNNVEYRNTENNISVENVNQNINLDITALASSKKQALALAQNKIISRIYVEAYAVTPVEFEEIALAVGGRTKIYLAMPHVFRLSDETAFHKQWSQIINKTDGFLVRNIESYFYLEKMGINEKIIFDYNLYTFNEYAKSVINHINQKVWTTVPVELNYRELKTRGCLDEEMVVYGYMPVMFTANCVAKTSDNCKKNNAVLSLKDRMSQNMRVQCVCKHCYNIIYNTNPLSLIKYKDEVKNLGVRSVRLEFTSESANEINNITAAFEQSFIYNNTEINEINNSTRGHFKRGVK